MAFDLKFNNRKEKIDYHEEGFFSLVNENDDFPTLNWLWIEFYSSPKIGPESCNKLVHELVQLQTLHEIDKNSKFCISRLLPFFSAAYLSSEQVTTVSD